jgi:Putative adipose-regulatory protein (Seipin)
MAGLVASAFGYLHERSEKVALLYNLKRALLPLIIGAVVLSGLLFSSTVAYFIFYWSYIPSVGIAKDIHLQFRFYILPPSLFLLEFFN